MYVCLGAGKESVPYAGILRYLGTYTVIYPLVNAAVKVINQLISKQAGLMRGKSAYLTWPGRTSAVTCIKCLDDEIPS